VLAYKGEKYLISGDIILQNTGTTVQDLSLYMKSLRRVKDLNCDYVLVSHSYDTEPDSVLMPAAPKIEAYIKYREDRDEAIVKALNDQPGKKATKEKLYDIIYGPRNLD